MASARNFKPLNPGDMRFIGDLEEAPDGLDTAGSPLTTGYTKFATGILFGFADYRGNETVVASTILSQITTYIVIRWRPGLEGLAPNQMRVRHVTEYSASPQLVDYYDIQGVLRDRTMRWALQLQCIRRDSSGYRSGAPS